MGTRVDDVNVNGQVTDYAKCLYVIIGKWVSYTAADKLCRENFKGHSC